MADNDTTIDGAGALVTYATDDISSVKYPRVKVSVGVDGAARDTIGKCTPYKLISAGSTNATNVKASAAYLHYIITSNLNAAVRYLKLYDKATAPTVGTDVPKMIIPLKVSTDPLFISFGDHPVEFLLGLGFALTTGIADTDTAAVAANEQIVNLGYN